MFSDLVGLVIGVAPVIGLLVWQERNDRRRRAAAIVRADIHANVTRALEGESVVAVDVQYPTAWRPRQVRLRTPSGYESIIGEASRAVLERVPFGYHVFLDYGGGS
jgi:hypothetical protein